MWDWTIGPGEAALVLVALLWGWRYRCAMCRQAPAAAPAVALAPAVAILEPVAVQVDVPLKPFSVKPTPPLKRKAQLFSRSGLLHSIRTIEGEPPETIQAAAGCYRLDRTVDGDHWHYRADPHGES